MMSSRLTVIDKNLPQLLGILEHNHHLVISLSGSCRAKGILSKDIHQNVLQSRKKTRDKALYLISEVWTAIRVDDTKCELFIQVLNKERLCKQLTKQIKKDIKELDSQNGANTATSHSSDPFPSSLMVRQTRDVTCSPSPEICKATCTPSTLVTGTCIMRSLGLHAEDQHNARMDVEQDKAIIADLKKEIQDLQVERRKAQGARNEAKHTKTALENRMNEVVRDLEQITTEKDNLKDSNELLKGKVAKFEKLFHADKKTKKLISQYEEQMVELENEKEQLRIKLEEASQRYEQLQHAADLVETINMQYNFKLEELIKEREQREELLRQANKRLARCKYIIIGLLIFIHVLIIIIVSLI